MVYRLYNHQNQMAELAEKVCSSSDKVKITTDTYPGAGKTGQGIILASQSLGKRKAEKVIWLTPQKALQSQVADATLNESSHMFKTGGRDVRLQTYNGLFPREDRDGMVATYSQLQHALPFFTEFTKKYSCVVILDELHQLSLSANGQDGVWTKNVHNLVSHPNVTVTLGMTGTNARHDNNKIYLMDYKLLSDGSYLPQPDILCTYKDAIAQNIVSLSRYNLVDGVSKYMDTSNDVYEIALTEAEAEEHAKALLTALTSKEYLDQVLDVALRDYNERLKKWPLYKGMAFGYSAAHARQIADMLNRRGIRVGVALSEDEDVAYRTLNSFKEDDNYQWIVTVGMASQGFDVPRVKDIIYLNNWRSKPALIQTFGRATRICREDGKPASEQEASITAPNDKRLSALVEKHLKLEQQEGLQLRGNEEWIDEPPGPRKVRPPRVYMGFVKLGARGTDTTVITQDNEVFVGADVDRINIIQSHVPGATTQVAASLLREMKRSFEEESYGSTRLRKNDQEECANRVLNTAERDEIYKEIENLSRSTCYNLARIQDREPNFQEVNAQLARNFGPKENRTDKDLVESLECVRRWHAETQQAVSKMSKQVEFSGWTG